MSEETKLSIEAPFQKLIENALNPITKSIGTTLSLIWETVFGRFDVYMEKKKIERAQNLEEFKKQISSKIENIPEEKMAAPNIAVIGEALESSKYYFDQEYYREMFSELIAKSLNIDYSDTVFPYYVSIIKSLSPNDVNVLKQLKEEYYLPIAKYRLNNIEQQKETDKLKLKLIPSDAGRFLTDYMLDGNKDDHQIKQDMLSISNLSRLGLINIGKEEFVDKSLYCNLNENCKAFLELKKENQDETHELVPFYSYIDLTPLGQNLIDIVF